MSGPSLAEVKQAGQPPEIIDRLNDEHWAGRLYMRRVSPGATWLFARLGLSPNMVTAGFVVSGLAAAAVVALGGLVSAIVAALLIQVYLLLDCSDGELARLTGKKSATGIYLDGIGHYLGETALLAGLGFRAQGHLTVGGGYVTAGLAAAVLAAVVRAETDNVVVARVKQGLTGTYGDAALAPRGTGLALARRLAAALKVHRVIQAIELSVLILAAAVIDASRGGLTATRALTLACLVIAGLMVVAHLAAIMASSRLK